MPATKPGHGAPCVACRAAALAGHVEQCDRCGTIRHIYYSCANRHCPKCQTRAKKQWIARKRELLPVPYVYLVFMDSKYMTPRNDTLFVRRIIGGCQMNGNPFFNLEE